VDATTTGNVTLNNHPITLSVFLGGYAIPRGRDGERYAARPGGTATGPAGGLEGRVTDLLMSGMSRERAEAHRLALHDLRGALAAYELRGRAVERLHLLMRSSCGPGLLPPEMDVYAGRRLIATVAVVDVPGGAGAWFLIKEPDGLPVRAHLIGDLDSTARDLAARDLATRDVATRDVATRDVATRDRTARRAWPPHHEGARRRGTARGPGCSATGGGEPWRRGGQGFLDGLDQGQC
jgi:hypothetical protein